MRSERARAFGESRNCVLSINLSARNATRKAHVHWQQQLVDIKSIAAERRTILGSD